MKTQEEQREEQLQKVNDMLLETITLLYNLASPKTPVAKRIMKICYLAEDGNYKCVEIPASLDDLANPKHP